jgi:hypothetical protein
MAGQRSEELKIMWQTLFWLTGGIYVLVMLVHDLDRKYYGFVKTYLEVHVWKKHLDPKAKDVYGRYISGVRSLERKVDKTWWQKKKCKWEVALIKKIMDESGWYTEKFTGKRKTKQQVKLRHQGKKVRYRNRIDKQR